MVIIFIILALICCPSQSATTSQAIIDSLRQEINKVAVSTPSNAAKFIKDINSQGNFNSDSFAVSQVNEILQEKWKFPAPIVKKFKNIIFAESLVFQTFTETLDQNAASLNEFVGAARRVGNNAEIACIQVSSSGNTITQYDVVETKSCKRVFIFFKKCKTTRTNVARGFRTDEIQVIFTALRASAYNYLSNQIQNPPRAIANFDAMKLTMMELNENLYPIEIPDNETSPPPPNDEVSPPPNDESPQNDNASPQENENEIPLTSEELQSKIPLGDGPSLITQLITNIIKRIPEIQRDIQQSTTVVVNQIVNRGFSSFMQRADIEQYNGIKDEYFNDFLDNLRESLNLPPNYDAQFKNIMEVTLYSTSNIWVVFNVIFSIKSGADCKFVCVMVSHDSENEKTDWLVANVEASFKLAPNLFVIQKRTSFLFGAWSSFEEKIALKPASLSARDLNLVFEFFEVVSFQRFAEFLSINFRRHALKTDGPIVGNAAAALAFLQTAISSVTASWGSIVNAFKTTRTSELKQILQGNGFSYYSQSGEMQKITGLSEKYYDTFCTHLLGRLQVPEGKKATFMEFFEEFKYIDSDNEWKAFDTVFSIDAGGKCKFVSILAHHNTDTNRMDFLIGNFVAAFKLAPNVAVIQESLSVLGGIFSNSKVVFKDIPRSVTEDDLKMVFNFFYLVTFKNFADTTGVQATFPSLR